MGGDDHHKLDQAKNIATGVAGGVGGGAIANKLGLGQVGGIAGSLAGSIGANKAEHKVEEKKTSFLPLQITLLKYSKRKMPDDKLNMAKNIGVSIAGSVGGAKVADKLHLGNAGHMATSIAGSLGANEALHHFENKDEKK